MDQRISTIEKSVIGQLPTVEPITDETSANLALQTFKMLKGKLKDAKGQYDHIADPIKEGLKRLKGEYDRVVQPLEATIAGFKGALEDWDARSRAAAEQAQAALDAHQVEIEQQAAERGQPAPPAPVVVPRAPMPTQKVPKWRVVDESLVPLEMPLHGQVVRLWDLNQGVITNIRRAAGDQPSPIPGIEFYYENVVTSR